MRTRKFLFLSLFFVVFLAFSGIPVFGAIFGYNTAGGTWLNQWNNNKVMSLYPLSVAGDVSSISCYQRDYNEVGGGGLTFGIYDASGTFKGATAAGVNTATSAWVTLTFSSPVHLVAGDYWLSVLLDDRTEFRYDAGVTNQYGTNGDDYSDGFANPMGSLSYSDYKLSIYATYTASGGGQSLTFGFSQTVGFGSGLGSRKALFKGSEVTNSFSGGLGSSKSMFKVSSVTSVVSGSVFKRVTLIRGVGGSVSVTSVLYEQKSLFGSLIADLSDSLRVIDTFVQVNSVVVVPSDIGGWTAFACAVLLCMAFSLMVVLIVSRRRRNGD